MIYRKLIVQRNLQEIMQAILLTVKFKKPSFIYIYVQF